MKNLLRQLTAVGALLVLMALTACSNDSLSDYSEQMNPVFQAHSDEFALANTALDNMAACAPTLGELVLTDCGADFVAALDRYERAASAHIDRWVLELEPPDEALLFHELTLELFQLRRAAFHTTRSLTEDLMEDPLLAIDTTYVAGLERVADQFDRADRLLVRILAEARRLGGVSITSDGGY